MKCELCGKKFDQKDIVIDENGLGKEHMFLEKNYCPTCRKVMINKYKKKNGGGKNGRR